MSANLFRRAKAREQTRLAVKRAVGCIKTIMRSTYYLLKNTALIIYNGSVVIGINIEETIDEYRKQHARDKEWLTSPGSELTYNQKLQLKTERGFKCDICGGVFASHHIDIHHKNGRHFDNYRGNLAVICTLCHKDLHKKRT